MKTSLIDIDAAAANRKRIQRLRAEENGSTTFATGRRHGRVYGRRKKPKGSQR